MKKILYVLALLAGTICLVVACSNDEPDTGNGNQDMEEVVPGTNHKILIAYFSQPLPNNVDAVTSASARRFFTTIRISARRTPTKPYASPRHYSKISNMPISYVARTKTSSIFSERLTVKRSTLTISVSTATVSSLPTEPEA